MNERVKDDLDTLYKARRVTHVGGFGDVEMPDAAMARRRRPVASSGLRQSLMGAIQTEILPACKEALFDGRDGVNDNANPIRLPSLRIASMAVGGAPVADIHAYLRSQPLSLARKANLLEIAAQRIGEGWCCENLNFVDVTVAVGRLQSTFRRLYQDTGAFAARRNGGSALILPAPGDEHVFGMFFVEELYRASGWATTLAMPETPGDWIKRASSQSFDVICISWSSERCGEALARCIGSVRKRARPAIICGGHAALLNQERLGVLGVDLVSASPQLALDFSRRKLLKQQERETTEARHYGG